MNRDQAWVFVAETMERWAADSATDIVWSGEYESRLGIRMRQRVRDFTTVWFEIGSRTVRFEAYLLPAPPEHVERVTAWCLRRNWTSWPSTIAANRDRDLFVIGRIPLDLLDETSLDQAVGSIHETVETSFRPLLRIVRETSP